MSVRFLLCRYRDNSHCLVSFYKAYEKIITGFQSSAGYYRRVELVCGGNVFRTGGTNLSHGQRQLLTIATALLSDAPIMILDEAISSVDTRTEVLIQKAMANLTAGRTSFIIAHRLSTIRAADQIFYMQDGDIKEVDSHEEILAQKGLYAKLYNSQFAET